MYFVEVPVTQREGKSELYTINVSNINYIRKWVGHKGEIQSVIYFQGNDAKYIVVAKPLKELLGLLGINSINTEKVVAE